MSTDFDLLLLPVILATLKQLEEEKAEKAAKEKGKAAKEEEKAAKKATKEEEKAAKKVAKQAPKPQPGGYLEVQRGYLEVRGPLTAQQQREGRKRQQRCQAPTRRKVAQGGDSPPRTPLSWSAPEADFSPVPPRPSVLKRTKAC